MSTGIEIELRRLGTTSLRLPRVALGCGNFGGVGSAPQFFGHGIAEGQAFELMDRAWQLGITHFDTADAYGGGRSESMIGRWIASRGVRPTITTKTYNPMHEAGDFGLAPERVRRQLESSLERLGVERVELYLAHEFDSRVPLTESFDAFESLVAAGKIDAYGVSNFDTDQLEAALAAGRPQAIQNERNLLRREDESLLSVCTAHEVSYLAFGPLAGGWLTGKYRRGRPYPQGSRMTQRPEPYERLERPRTFDVLERLEDYAGEHDRTLAGLAIAWLLDDERIGQVVTGPTRPEHLNPVGEALADPLAPGERASIEELL